VTLRPDRDALVEPGDYFSTTTELYRVERVIGDRILLEDCRTESLIEVGTEQVLVMNPVTPAR
jgi:hypothetical protein